MKLLSKLFAAAAILLSDIMCAVVAFNWATMLNNITTSAPASVSLLYAIPFGTGIAVFAILSLVFSKKAAKQRTDSNCR